MTNEMKELEARLMRHLGTNLAFELTLIALCETHPNKDALHTTMVLLRKRYDELVQGSIMMVDDVSPQTYMTIDQMNKMMERMLRSAKPSVDAN